MDVKCLNESYSYLFFRFFSGKFQDLKKQTALRLAQEQNDLPSQQEIDVGENGRQQQGGQNHPRVLNNNYTTYPRHVLHPQDSHSHHYEQHTLDGIPIVLLNTENEQRQLQQERQQHQFQHHQSGYLGPSSYNHMSSMPPQDQNAIPPGIADNHLMVSALCIWSALIPFNVEKFLS